MSEQETGGDRRADAIEAVYALDPDMYWAGNHYVPFAFNEANESTRHEVEKTVDVVMKALGLPTMEDAEASVDRMVDWMIDQTPYVRSDFAAEQIADMREQATALAKIARGGTP